MSVEKKLKTETLGEAAQDVGNVYIPNDVTDMSMEELVTEVESLREKTSQLSFCQVLCRVEEILKVFAGTPDPGAQKKMIKLLEEGSHDSKVALQESFSNIIKDVCSGSYNQEELSTLTERETMNNVIIASHVKHLLGLMGIRLKIFRGNKKEEPDSDVPMQPILNIIKLDDIKGIVRRELSRHPIDELVEVISDETERERFKAAVHDELNEVAAGSGRIETGHLTLKEIFATPWLKLWQKIRASENVIPRLEFCPVCLEHCEENSVLITTDSCNDNICLKCAVQCFGSGMERSCPQCFTKFNYWTTSKEFNILRGQMNE